MRPKTSRAARQEKPAKGALTPERIVEEAIGLADKEGLEALTTRRLARHLGVEAMALYHHFKSKDALLDAMTERLESQARPQSKSADWRAHLHAVALAQVETAMAHAQTAPLMTSRRAASASVFANNEDVLSCLVRAGLDERQRVVWVRLFAALVNGLALYLTAIRARPRAANVIDPKLYPLTARAVAAGGTVGYRDTLDEGVAAIIRGIDDAAKR